MPSLLAHSLSDQDPREMEHFVARVAQEGGHPNSLETQVAYHLVRSHWCRQKTGGIPPCSVAPAPSDAETAVLGCFGVCPPCGACLTLNNVLPCPSQDLGTVASSSSTLPELTMGALAGGTRPIWAHGHQVDVPRSNKLNVDKKLGSPEEKMQRSKKTIIYIYIYST